MDQKEKHIWALLAILVLWIDILLYYLFGKGIEPVQFGLFLTWFGGLFARLFMEVN